MSPEDKPRFAAGLNHLCAAYGKQPTEPMLAAYWHALKDLDIDSFAAGCSRAIRESEFFPVPAVLRKLCGIEPRDAVIAGRWLSLRKYLASAGARASIDFGDPVMHATIRAMGGWVELCRRETEWLNTFGRAEFTKTYSALLSANLSQAETARLVGEDEHAQRLMSEYHRSLCPPPRTIAIDTNGSRVLGNRGVPAQLSDGVSDRQVLDIVAEKTGVVVV
jgi:hypothetical protein